MYRPSTQTNNLDSFLQGIDRHQQISRDFVISKIKCNSKDTYCIESCMVPLFCKHRTRV